jgi:hypothetical protein
MFTYPQHYVLLQKCRRCTPRIKLQKYTVVGTSQVVSAHLHVSVQTSMTYI